MGRTRAVALGFVVLLAAGCARNPGPGDPGYPYNLNGRYTGTFEVEGITFEAVLELATARGGEVTGDFRVTSPVTVRGEFVGTVADGSLGYTVTYVNQDDGCSGTARGKGRVEEGGGVVRGTIQVSDSCSGSGLGGTFTLRRRGPR